MRTGDPDYEIELMEATAGFDVKSATDDVGRSLCMCTVRYLDALRIDARAIAGLPAEAHPSRVHAYTDPEYMEKSRRLFGQIMGATDEYDDGEDEETTP